MGAVPTGLSIATQAHLSCCRLLHYLLSECATDISDQFLVVFPCEVVTSVASKMLTTTPISQS